MWSFSKQLKVGEQGEQLILNHYREPIVYYKGRRADFVLPLTGELLELKTDTYDRQKTSNFFFERWSDVDNKKPGGPWQARAKSASRFIYLFMSDGTYYEFQDIDKLCRLLDQYCTKLEPIRILNKGWTTVGYKVPRDALSHLWEEYKIEPENS